MKICIDFQGGAHGNYLEFICNIVAGVKTNDSPFNALGAAHKKIYLSQKVFYANHYSFGCGMLDTNNVVAVKIEVDDLLPLSQVSLLRAGNYGYQSNELEINTFNKLNNSSYKWTLDTIVNSFFKDQIKTSYDAVKDSSWPDICTIEDFERLPERIKQECIEVHKLELLEFNENKPDCPRHILREFFQIGFMNPTNHCFITQQRNMVYAPGTKIYDFAFKNFYNKDAFINEVKSIANWAGFTFNDWERISDLHEQFLSQQIFKDSKVKCDKIVQDIINGNEAPSVDLFEEAYINAMLLGTGHECRY